MGELVYESAVVHSTSENPFVCNEPAPSADIATLRFWYLQLQIGKLAPHDTVQFAHYYDAQVCSFSKTLVYARCFMHCCTVHYVIKLLIWDPDKGCYDA